MRAIILAGGKGTRLANIINDKSKVMVDVNGKPFLSYILDFLIKNGINRVILSVGYKYESIIEYFGYKYKSIEIEYSIETEALGTGGAIKLALSNISDEYIYVLNGDTFFDINLSKMIKSQYVTLAVKYVSKSDRYGLVRKKFDEIIDFVEKKEDSSGYINCGIYLVNVHSFLSVNLRDKFSFERDFLQTNVHNFKFKLNVFKSYFIDIGVPEDYYKAIEDFK